MKKEKNNNSAKRLIVITSLCLVLLIAIGAASFAWIRNYVDVDTLQVRTGKMLFSLKLYRTSDPSNPETLFDTKDPEDLAASQLDKRLEREIENAIINIKDGEEVFFVVEKYPDSIDFDIALSFDRDGLEAKSFDNIGQMNFAMYDDSAKFNESGVDGYFNGISSNSNKGAVKDLGYIWNTVQKSSILKEQQYSCIRLKLDRDPDVSAPFEDDVFPFRIGFCVAQTGALPDEDGVDRYYADSEDTLNDAMQKYGFNDEIYITNNIDFTGDLVFTRPCTLVLIRSTLYVKGNVIFSYMYGGKFTVNTVSDGHIIVQNNNGSGGNFRIDLPDTTIELLGANTDPIPTENWRDVNSDIYVEGSFTANASKNEGEGLFFKGARISKIDVSGTNPVYSADIKPMLINGSTRVSVSNRTRLGELTANVFCKHLIVENSGYISKIDISDMGHDTTMLSKPSIFIDNAGTLGDSRIILPNWSKQFKNDSESNKSPDDNTHIRANKGSGELRAVTAEFKDLSDAEANVAGSGTSFFSDGKQGANGLRDEIDYMLRTQFVETIDGDKTKIVIHYETPSPLILATDEYSDLSALKALSNYVAYYAEKGDIAPANELTEVKIICYGDKVLSSNDYTFIKTMLNVTDLDLADALSEGKRVPNEAFKNMSSLVNVKMSESDTVWGRYLFTGSSVIEITFPQSLTKLDNPLNNAGTAVKEQAVLDGIRYVYTSIYVVDGLYRNQASKQYFFTPDEYTYKDYREYYNNVQWKSKIFLGEGVVRFGEYFLRLKPNTVGEESTCDFVVYTGGLNSEGKLEKWLENEKINCGFDFQRIIVDGTPYTITRYDAYALFDKLYCEENLEVTFTNKVAYIGERAFSCSSSVNTDKGLEKVTINGDPEILGSAFSYNDALLSFNAPNLTTLKGGSNLSYNDKLEIVYMPKLTTVEGNYDLANCPQLQRVDIGVIKRDAAKNGYFYAAMDVNTNAQLYHSEKLYNTYSYAKFFIHVDENIDRSAYPKDFVALAADYRHIFVNQEYADLYRKNTKYTGVVDMGDNNPEDLLAANASGNDVALGEDPAYYYIVDGSNAKLVACMLAEINNGNVDYVTIASFNHYDATKGEIVNYPVTYIGSAAYHFTAITARNIKIASGVTELGEYTFDSIEGAIGSNGSKDSNVARFKKYCITFDLNDVVKAGEGAFQGMDMARITGNKLEEVAENTLSYNQNLYIAYLPELSRSCPAGSSQTVPKIFENCPRLRISYTSASKYIAFDTKESLRASYIRFINTTETGFNIANVNTVINSGVKPQSTFSHNYINVANDFTGVYFSDYYELAVDLVGLKDTFVLPGYVYYEENGDMTLFAVSPDVTEFGDFGATGKNYTTPSALYSENGKYVSKDNGTIPEYNVTKIGKYAYGATGFSGLDNFIVGLNVKEIEAGGLTGTAYRGGSLSVITLDDVECLDLSNVETVGPNACQYSYFTSLKAENLKSLGAHAFAYCYNLKSAYLPAFVEATGTYVFRECNALESITFGRNAKTLSQYMFYCNSTSALKKITILNPDKVVTVTSPLINTSKFKNQVVLSIPKSIYSQYVPNSSAKFGGIEKFAFFGASTQLGNITYYWNVIDENAKTAYVNYIEGTLGTTLNIPATLDGYTIVALSPEAVAALSGVQKLGLPDNMEYLTFTTADLPTSVTSLDIVSGNSKFMANEGVLYSKDASDNPIALLVYPKAKVAKSFSVPNTVTEIGYRAFYGTFNLQTLNISSAVIVRDQAFENAKISTINFTNTTASTFAGRDILLGANDKIVINVKVMPNVLIDYSVIGKFQMA